MAAIETILQAHLTSNVALAALVGNRIYPDLVPQNVTLPAIRYVVIDRVELLVKPNVPTMRHVQMRVQLDIYATTYAGAKAVQKALTDALYAFGPEVNDSLIGTRVVDAGDETDSDEHEHHVSIDASITFNE